MIQNTISRLYFPLDINDHFSSTTEQEIWKIYLVSINKMHHKLRMIKENIPKPSLTGYEIMND